MLNSLTSLPPWGGKPEGFGTVLILSLEDAKIEDVARKAQEIGVGGVSLPADDLSGIEDFLSHRIPVVASVRHPDEIDMLPETIDGVRVEHVSLCDEILMERVGELGKPVLVEVGTTDTAGDLLLGLSAFSRTGDASKVVLLYQGGEDSRSFFSAGSFQQEFELPLGFSLPPETITPERLDWLVAICGSHGYLIVDSKVQDLDHATNAARSLAELRERRAIASGDRIRDSRELVARRVLPTGRPISRGDLEYRGKSQGNAPALALVVGRCPSEEIQRGASVSLSSLALRRVALIQVRRRSSRLPDKALMRLGTKPAIAHVVKRTKAAKELDEVIICTTDLEEDGELVEVGESLGVSSFRGSLDDVMQRFLGAAEAFDADILVRITGDNPLIDPHCIDEAVRYHLAKNADYTITAGLPVGTGLEIFATSTLRKAYALARNPERSEDIAYYLERSDVFRVCRYTPSPEYVAPDLILALNRPEDAEVIQAVFEALEGKDGMFPLSQAIAWLRGRPGLARKNGVYEQASTACDTRLSFSRFAEAVQSQQLMSSP